MNAEQTIDTAKSLQRVQNYLERLEVAKGYHKECIHAFIDKDGAEIPLLATDLKAILQQVATTSAHSRCTRCRPVSLVTGQRLAKRRKNGASDSPAAQCNMGRKNRRSHEC